MNLKLKSERMGIVRRLQISGHDSAQNHRTRKGASSKQSRALVCVSANNSETNTCLVSSSLASGVKKWRKHGPGTFPIL